MIWRRAVTLTNVRVHTPAGTATSVRFGTRVLALGDAPHRRDIVVDGQGAWVLPGLINAHDHLELNHYGRQPLGAPYRNVEAWVADMRPRLSSDPAILRGRQRPLEARVFVGALKNLLAGVALVAHHNPIYPHMTRVSPVKILRRFGWAHSLAMATQPVGARGERGGEVVQRHQATPADQAFILHAAEGVDAQAQQEVTQLEALGVLDTRTVLVHALATDAEARDRLLARGLGLVWCPVSNHTLFGRTWSRWPTLAARMAVATDSRLTGARDLLEELHSLEAVPGATPEARLAAVTTGAASVVRVREAGCLRVGGAADLVVSPAAPTAAESLAVSHRADLRLVVIDGRPRLGCASLREVFVARGVSLSSVRIDGTTRVMDAALTRAMRHYAVDEPGLRVCEAAW